MKLIPTLLARHETLVRFACVSVLGTAVDFLVLWLLYGRAGINIVPAKLISSEATVINTFVWNQAWTFKGAPATLPLPLRFLSFNATYLGSVVISVAVVAGITAWLGPAYYLPANVLTLPVNFAWNYLWSSRVIWRQQSARQEREPVLIVPAFSDEQD